MKNIVIANNFYLRLKGLMFKKNVNYALLIPNCKSIHTFFMRFNLDIIILDQNYKIITIHYNVKPNKVLFIKRNKKKTSILEIPSRLKHNYQLNEKIIWQ